jgi:hypothetical protein
MKTESLQDCDEVRKTFGTSPEKFQKKFQKKVARTTIQGLKEHV